MSPSTLRIVPLALSAAGMTLAASGSADAAIIYSGNISIAVPGTGNGVYVDVNNGFTASTTAASGWDINLVGSSGNFSLLAPEGAQNFLRYPGSTSTGAGNFPPSGATVAASGSYGSGSVVFGTSPGQWLALGTSYFGFRFNMGTATHYGWGRVSFNGAGAATITALAFQDVAGQSIPVNTAPTPGAAALLGLAGLAGRRRRR